MSRAAAVVSALVAVVLVLSLCLAAGVGAGELGEAIGQVGPGAFALIVAATAGLTVLSAEKWVLLLRRRGTAGGEVGRRAAVFYGSLGSVLGQFLPLQVAIALTRSVGLRLDGRAVVARGIGATVVEQAFDGIVAVVLAVPALLFLSGEMRLGGWFGLAVPSLALGWLGAQVANRGASSLAGRLSGGSWLPDSGASVLRRIAGVGLTRDEVTRLYVLSLGRSVLLAGRVAVVAAVTDVPPGILPVALLTPLVQIPVMVAVTPGGLGVAEWTWSGLLAIGGASFAEASVFALLLRILGLAALAIVVTAAGLVHVCAPSGSTGETFS